MKKSTTTTEKKNLNIKNILLCGLKYDLNLGDPVIYDSCEYLIKNITKGKNINIESIDLSGRYDFRKIYHINLLKKIFNKFILKILTIFTKMINKIRLKKLASYIDCITWYFSNEYNIYNKYYKNIIKNADAIIFVGGGLIKWKYQDCYHYIDYITNVAKQYNIPVSLNAVGVEDFDEKNAKCKLLKKALNRSCVKMITTRDDIETLEKYIEKEDIICSKVSDVAVFASDVYNIKKDNCSEYVGLGICRGKLFEQNGIYFTEEDLINLWIDIIKELENKNVKYKIYTNGLKEDNDFAVKLAQKLNINSNDLILPETPRDLVKNISKFKGIINTRLHSSIIAFSLEVPSIGLVWNKKLKFFGESIGYADRFLEVDNFNAVKIVEQLDIAIKEGYKVIKPKEYRRSVLYKLKEFLNIYVL